MAVKAVRSALGSIANAEAVERQDEIVAPDGNIEGPIAGAVHGLGAGDVARKELTELDLIRIVTAEVAERLNAATDYEALGQHEAARELRQQAAALKVHLAETR